MLYPNCLDSFYHNFINIKLRPNIYFCGLHQRHQKLFSDLQHSVWCNVYNYWVLAKIISDRAISITRTLRKQWAFKTKPVTLWVHNAYQNYDLSFISHNQTTIKNIWRYQVMIRRSKFLVSIWISAEIFSNPLTKSINVKSDASTIYRYIIILLVGL